MNGTPRTPRLRSAYPATPSRGQYELDRSSRPRRSSGLRTSTPGSAIPNIDALKPSPSTPPSQPLIPTRIVDAPSQRLYAVAIYTALFTWRLMDYYGLGDPEEQSLWLFMKWVAIDGVFLFALPELRIPWLEWDSAMMTLLFAAHTVLNAFLMFQIPIPIGAALAAIWRSIYGVYEVAVNEHTVNPLRVTHNESLILGRQIIHILPEGSAILNPERKAFCLDVSGGPGRSEVRLPIKINSTNPISIELVRADLDTLTNETIIIGKSDIKRMHKEASRLVSYSEHLHEPKTLFHVVKKPGLYSLARVIDETNLEVPRKQLAHTAVVPCPRAIIKPSSEDRCKGDLSDIELEVTGTPPLRVKYRKIVNRATHYSTFESIMPEEFFTPLTRHQHESGSVLPSRMDRDWARSRTITVPLSESLIQSGRSMYSIEEVKDGFGNNITYGNEQHDAQDRKFSRAPHLHHLLNIHERPSVQLSGCSPQDPLKIAKGRPAYLPVQYVYSGKGLAAEAPYHLSYTFTPENVDETSTALIQRKQITIKDLKQQPQIQEPGLYTLTDVSSDFCEGEVMEPASCLLQNPPEPDLAITTEEIFDKCAGSPIGLRVDMDLIGTPPFRVTYRQTRKGGGSHYAAMYADVHGLRGQIELTPPQAGHYSYEFVEISDAVYHSYSLKHRNLKIEQDVKPSASARFVNAGATRTACIEEAVAFEVALQGEGPFNIEYEVVHGGKRSKKTIEDIKEDRIVLVTDALLEGGEHVLALSSVTDRMGCKEFLKGEAHIAVRHQKPKIGFGHLDGKRTVDLKAGNREHLPLRLSGEGPWTAEYRDAAGQTQSVSLQRANDRIIVDKAGTYELLSVHDASCPGEVDPLASVFDVRLIPRPEIRIADDDRMLLQGRTFIRQEVCEGEDDSVEVLFKGSAPYQANYVENVKPDHGVVAPKVHELRAALNVAPMRLNTAQAGLYKYEFTQLKDANYKDSPRQSSQINIQQRVNARPSATFANPGKTYSYCSVESDGEEVIPVTLQGAAPFELEVEIRHHGTGKPENIRLTGITSPKHEIKIPHRTLHPGKSAVYLRRVSDARGCSRILDSSVRVQISVHDLPTITPLEASEDYCVGDRLNFALSGSSPFTVFYTFEGQARKAQATGTTFRRLAERPGTFTITGLQDSASQCKSATAITKHIHGMPSVRVSKGRDTYVDIHEGGETEILFEFGGVPPFEFTYTRSSNAEKGKRSVVLDMKSEISDQYSMKLRASEEGTYEVTSIKDRYCSYTKPGVKTDKIAQQKLLEN